MQTLTRHLKLLALVIRKGKIRHSGADFTKRRQDVLRGVSKLLPPEDQQGEKFALKKWLSKNPWLKGLLGQAAFVTNALRRNGGHLSVPDLHLSYIRNPRVASTALCQAMLQSRFPEWRGQARSAEEINFITDVLLEKQPGPGNHEDIFFMVVRNPFARIVSVYREFFERQSPFFLYEEYLFGVLRKDMSFKQFVKVVVNISDAWKDQHFRPQHTFLSFYASRKIDVKILKLEEPEMISEFLSGFELLFEGVNKSEAAYDYRKYYDGESLELARQIYARDVALFGYERAYEETRIACQAAQGETWQA